MKEDTTYIDTGFSPSPTAPTTDLSWIRQQAIYEILRSPNAKVQNIVDLIEAADKIADFIVNGVRRGNS